MGKDDAEHSLKTGGAQSCIQLSPLVELIKSSSEGKEKVEKAWVAQTDEGEEKHRTVQLPYVETVNL